MDKKRSILNVCISIASKLILLVLSIVVRRLLIRYIGNDVNGLNSLYANIIGILSVSELGIGSSIVFSMYKPIVDGDKRKVAALYCLYKKSYIIIGTVILISGIVVSPFLPVFIGDFERISENVYTTFLLTLISVVLSYFYSAKTSLIDAYKNNYITTCIFTIARVLRSGLQIVVILKWKSYTIFLVCNIVETSIIWLLSDIKIKKKYNDIITLHEIIDYKTKSEIKKNVKAMMMHKVGIVMVSAVDSLIISAFIGVVILGKYANYTIIIGIIANVIELFFAPLTSVVGHLYAIENKEETKKWFNHLYWLNYILGVSFFLGYYAVIDNLVSICFGSELLMPRLIVFIITLNKFTLYMRSTVLLFRDASGTFYNDRWKPVAEGMVNLVLSLLFVMIFPEEYKVVGVIIATIITTLTICNTVEPYVIFHHVFGMSPKKFYLKNYAYTAIFVSCLFIMNALIQNYDNQIKGLFINGLISVGLCITVLCLLSLVDKDFRYEAGLLIRKTTAWVRKRTM